MGYPHVTVIVSNLQKSGTPYTASFLVDTGAIVCLAPAAELRQAGIEPEGRETYELANGTPVEYDFGFARLSFMGSDTVAKIIFGPDHVEPLLGVTALESVGIGVDPISQTLKRYAALPLKSTRLHPILPFSLPVVFATRSPGRYRPPTPARSTWKAR